MMPANFHPVLTALRFWVVMVVMHFLLIVSSWQSPSPSPEQPAHQSNLGRADTDSYGPVLRRGCLPFRVAWMIGPTESTDFGQKTLARPFRLLPMGFGMSASPATTFSEPLLGFALRLPPDGLYIFELHVGQGSDDVR